MSPVLSSRRPTLIPAEILFDIVCYVVAEYVDFLIAGVLDDPCNYDALTTTLTPEEEERNPIVPLFSVSFQFRDTVRKALSLMLDIPRNEDGR